MQEAGIAAVTTIDDLCQKSDRASLIFLVLEIKKQKNKQTTFSNSYRSMQQFKDLVVCSNETKRLHKTPNYSMLQYSHFQISSLLAIQLRFGKPGVMFICKRARVSQSVSGARVFSEHSVEFFRENM